jgi:cell wall-associated NlpC family hydrolase
MKRVILGVALLYSSSFGKSCNISVDYHQNSDGSITMRVGSNNCNLSISLSNNKSEIRFTPDSKSAEFSRSIKTKSFDEVSGDGDIVDKIISIAKSKVGSKYEPGATGPNSFDCSGFVYYVFKKAGIKVPRVSTNQAKIGKKLQRDELKKGDIVCFDTAKRGKVNHTGIYLGDGRFIHSSSGRAYSVTVSNLDKGFYKEKFRWGVRVLK